MLWWCIVLFSTTACGAQSIWYGRSPNRAQTVEVWAQGDRQWLETDGRASPLYDGVGVDVLTFSPDSTRLAVPVQRDGRWTLIVDGQESRLWRGIGAVVFSDDSRHLAYAVESDDGWHVVSDGRLGPRFDGLLKDTLRFGPASKQLVYVAQRGSKVHVVLDHEMGDGYDGVGQLSFSDDGRHLAYLARRGSFAHVVVDGVIGPPYHRIGELRIGLNGHIGYLAIGARGHVAVINGVESAPAERMVSLSFSSDGRRFAYVAFRTEQWFVEFNGTSEGPYQGIAAGSLAFSPDGTRIAYAAKRAERWYIVLDGQEIGPYDGTGAIAFDVDGSRSAHVSYRGEQAIVVIDGDERPAGRWAGNLVLGRHRERFAYLSIQGAKMLAVVDGSVYPFSLIVDGSLMFSDDGRHWACVAAVDESSGFWLVVDGKPRIPFDMTELVYLVSSDPIAMMYSPQTEARVRDMVAADVRRLLALDADDATNAAPRPKNASIAFVRQQPSSNETLSMPRGGVEFVGDLRFVTGRANERIAEARFTDLVLASTSVRYGLTRRISLTASVMWLAKQPIDTHASWWQRGGGALMVALSRGWMTHVELTGGTLMAAAGSWGRIRSGLRWSRRLSTSVGIRSGLGVAATMLMLTDDRRFRQADVEASTRLSLHRSRSQLFSWIKIGYSAPLAYDDDVIAPVLGVPFTPVRRIHGEIGLAVTVVSGWDVFARVSAMTGSDLDSPGAMLPIVDGGFEQRQFMFGLKRRYRVDGRDAAHR